METDGIYHFNRCRRCTTLLTKLQIIKSFSTGIPPCACGSGMFGPTNPIGLEWLSPRVLRMVVMQLLGRLAPPPNDGIVPPVPTSMKFRGVAPLSPDEVRAPEDGE